MIAPESGQRRARPNPRHTATCAACNRTHCAHPEPIYQGIAPLPKERR